MMQGAVNRVATGGGIGSRKRVGKHRRTCRQQRQKHRDCKKSTQNIPESHAPIASVLPGKAQAQIILFVHIPRKKVRLSLDSEGRALQYS